MLVEIKFNTNSDKKLVGKITKRMVVLTCGGCRRKYGRIRIYGVCGIFALRISVHLVSLNLADIRKAGRFPCVPQNVMFANTKNTEGTSVRARLRPRQQGIGQIYSVSLQSAVDELRRGRSHFSHNSQKRERPWLKYALPPYA